jgi:hypothetical protein
MAGLGHGPVRHGDAGEGTVLKSQSLRQALAMLGMARLGRGEAGHGFM